MDGNVIKIGTWTHHRDRLDLASWPGDVARQNFAALARASEEYEKLKGELHAGGRHTEAGVREKLREHVAQTKIGALLAEAEHKGKMAAAAPAATRASMRQAFEKKLDESSPRQQALRAERRQFLRSLDIGERIQLALKPDFADAVLEVPREMTGLTEEIFARVEATAVEAAFPGQLAAAAIEGQRGEWVLGAAAGLRAQLAEDGAI